VSFDEVRRVAVAAQELLQLLVADPGQHGRVGNLVAIEMEDRQDDTVRHWIQELVGVPARRQRSGLGLPVAYDAGDDPGPIVERGPISVRDGVSELSALVDRSWGLRSHVTRDPPGKRELGEEMLHPL